MGLLYRVNYMITIVILCIKICDIHTCKIKEYV